MIALIVYHKSTFVFYLNRKYIKENLMRSIEGQMCNIYEADCDELGEAIDMLKDLEEALYYAQEYDIVPVIEIKKCDIQYLSSLKEYLDKTVGCQINVTRR